MPGAVPRQDRSTKLGGEPDVYLVGEMFISVRIGSRHILHVPICRISVASFGI